MQGYILCKILWCWGGGLMVDGEKIKMKIQKKGKEKGEERTQKYIFLGYKLQLLFQSFRGGISILPQQPELTKQFLGTQ